MRKTILSRRLVKVRAAMIDKTLMEISAAAGFPPASGYIYRTLDRDNVQLSTVNRIAAALGCSAGDILEEVEMDDQPEAAQKRLDQRTRHTNGLVIHEGEATFTAHASEAVLAREWDTPEEDEAWADL
jgi:DNA-binding Xre family transcriptional regulator